MLRMLGHKMEDFMETSGLEIGILELSNKAADQTIESEGIGSAALHRVKIRADLEGHYGAIAHHFLVVRHCGVDERAKHKLSELGLSNPVTTGKKRADILGGDGLEVALRIR